MLPNQNNIPKKLFHTFFQAYYFKSRKNASQSIIITIIIITIIITSISIMMTIAMSQGKMILHYGDLIDGNCLVHIINTTKPTEIYNLGAQSHVKVAFMAMLQFILLM